MKKKLLIIVPIVLVLIIALVVGFLVVSRQSFLNKFKQDLAKIDEEGMVKVDANFKNLAVQGKGNLNDCLNYVNQLTKDSKKEAQKETDSDLRNITLESYDNSLVNLQNICHKYFK